MGLWFAKLAEEQPTDTSSARYTIVLPVTLFAGYRRGDEVRFDAPGADSSTRYTLPSLPPDGALRFTLLLDARVATGDTISITEIAMKRAVRSANGAKRPAKAPARLELGNEPVSHRKAPRAADPAPAGAEK